jgi:hypothetical protein
MRTRTSLVAAALCLLSFTVIAVAQNQTLKFEVATVKPSRHLRRGRRRLLGFAMASTRKSRPSLQAFPFRLQPKADASSGHCHCGR